LSDRAAYPYVNGSHTSPHNKEIMGKTGEKREEKGDVGETQKRDQEKEGQKNANFSPNAKR